MTLHPIFQDITDTHRGLRPVRDHLGPAIVKLDRAVARKAGKSVIDTLAEAGGWVAPEEGTERYRMLEAALDARGGTYRYGGGDGAHDAWSLARHCAVYATERDCIDVERDPVPGWGITQSEARKALTQWGLVEVKARHAAPGDLLLFEVDDAQFGKHPIRGGVHVAVMTAPGGDMSWAMQPGRTRTAATVVHAFYGGCGIGESPVLGWWADRFLTAFSFDAPRPPLRAVAREAA